MRALDAEKELRTWAVTGKCVFTRTDLEKIFGETSRYTLSATLRRLVNAGLLIRAAHDVYVFAFSNCSRTLILEQIALILRKGHYVYESYESALSQWGLISQIPIDRITCATTGRSGEYRTPYGVIELTHTATNPQVIAANLVKRSDHLLPIANKELALANLRRSRRNLDLVKEI